MFDREPNGGGIGHLRRQYFQKELRKQELEIIKLELEIRSLRRAEKLMPPEREFEAGKLPKTTTVASSPLLNFAQKGMFPFDF